MELASNVPRDYRQEGEQEVIAEGLAASSVGRERGVLDRGILEGMSLKTQS